MPAPDRPTDDARLAEGEARVLRFTPGLEAEYRALSLQGLAHARMVAVLAATAIWLGFIGVDLALLDPATHGSASPMLWQLALVRVLVLVVFVTCSVQLWRNGQGPHPIAVTGGLFALLILGSAVAIIIYRKLQVPHESNVLALVVMAMFLPLGLRFVEAVALALLSIVALALLGVVMLEGAERQLFMRVPFIALVAGGVSAIGAYLREVAQRKQFLLQRELEWQALRDPLTGLFNRRMFHRQLDAAIQRSQQHDGTVVLAMVDVDHFKLYNDTYGHQAGDEALQRVAGVLELLTRAPRYLAFRTGGEEMGLILYGASDDEVVALCTQLLDEVHALNIGHVASATSERLSVSVGCARHAPQELATALYRRADRQLYRAKELGRNCVVMEPTMGKLVLHGHRHAYVVADQPPPAARAR